MAQAQNIKVVARVRPADGDTCLALTENGIKPQEERADRLDKTYNFDHVFNQSSRQDDLFKLVGEPMVASAIEGFNGTVFAYGQTGSGKTHSMLGPSGGSPECLDPSAPLYGDRGLVPRLVEDLFNRLGELCSSGQFTFSVTCHIFEIYNEELIDLLATEESAPQEPLRMEGARETFRIRGLVEIALSSPGDLLRLIGEATARRHVASTAMNDRSSRSHTVVQLNAMHRDQVQGTVTTSQLNLVDLAGSERVGKTHATGKTAFEGTRINLSLSTLGKVITQLCKGEKHISFRDSLLTRVLQNSLGGNALTTLICAMSPLPVHVSETVSTLRFAESAKLIRNRVRVNKQRTAAEWEILCKQKDDEIASLLQKLELAKRGDRQPSVSFGVGDPSTQEEMDELSVKLEAALEECDVTRKSLEAAEVQKLEHQRTVAFLTQEREQFEARHRGQLEDQAAKLSAAAQESADAQAELRLRDEKLSDQTLQISELEAELDVVQAEWRQKEGELELERLEMMEKFADLTIQRDQAQEDLKQAKISHVQETAQHESLKLALKEADDAAQQHRGQLTAMEGTLKEKQRLVEQAQADATTAASKHDEHAAELQRRIGELEVQLQEGEAGREVLEKEIQGLHAGARQAAKENADLGLAMADVSAKLREAQGAAQQQEASVLAAKGGEEAMREALQQKDASLQHQMEEIREKERLLQEKDGAVKQAEVAMEGLTADVARVKQSLETERSARARAEADDAAKQLLISELERRLAQREADSSKAVEESAATIAAHELELSTVREDAKKAAEHSAAQRTALQEQIAGMEADMQVRVREADAMKSQWETQAGHHAEQHKKMKEELEKTRAEARESRRERDEATQQRDKMAREREMDRETTKKLAETAERAHQRCVDRDDELEELRQKLADAERVVEQLKRDERTVAASMETAAAETDRQAKQVRQLGQAVESRQAELTAAHEGLSSILDIVKQSSDGGDWADLCHRISIIARRLAPRGGALENLSARLYEETSQHAFVEAVEIYFTAREADVTRIAEQVRALTPGSVVPPRIMQLCEELCSDLVKMKGILEDSEFYDVVDEEKRQDCLAQATGFLDTMLGVRAKMANLSSRGPVDTSDTSYKIGQIAAIGFTEQQAAQALEAAGGDIQRAIDSLLS